MTTEAIRSERRPETGALDPRLYNNDQEYGDPNNQVAGIL